MKEGSLYPALYRLESAGLLQGRWEDGSSGRRGAPTLLSNHPQRQTKTPTRPSRVARVRQRRRHNPSGPNLIQYFERIIHSIHLGSPMHELEVHVDRILASLPASAKRKLEIRSELLNHLRAPTKKNWPEPPILIEPASSRSNASASPPNSGAIYRLEFPWWTWLSALCDEQRP